MTGVQTCALPISLTTVLVGHLRGRGRTLYGWGEHVPAVRSMLSRARLAQRIPLTPEGIPADKACAAIDVALNMGVRLLNFSFHSPSLAIGFTPYVRDAADLKAFYGWWDTVFDHCRERGVAPASLDEILTAAGVPVAA